MSQKYTEEELANMIPVFHLKPASSTRTKCTLTMYIDKAERLSDDQLEVETSEEIREKIGNNTLLIGTVNSYVIIGKYCACNIPGSYLLENSKFPVYYLSVIYNKQFVTGCLFNLFLYFTMDDDTKKRLNTPQKYYKALMDGKFTVQCMPTDEDFLDKVKSFVEQEIMLKYQDEFSKNSDLEFQDKIMDSVVNDIDSEMNEIKKFFESQPFDKENDRVPTQKSVFKRLNEMCDSKVFKKLVSYGLLIREKERYEEKCPDASYEAPKNIINLREIKENPEKLDEIMFKRRETGEKDGCEDF
jgi:hypothetical protein